jgi:hypothetical protein
MRPYRRIPALALLVTVAATSAACDGSRLLSPCDAAGAECAGSGSLTHADKVEHFIELAFGDGGGRMIRWAEPVAVEVHGGSEADRVAAREAAAWLSSASGHPVHVVASGGTVAIRIVPRGEFSAHIPGAPSSFSGICAPRFGADRVIHSATIVVASDLPAPDRSRVILHELAHALGLTGHSKRYPQSLLYATIGRNAGVLEQDRFALQTLYHTDMHPGMDAAQARSILARAVAR